MSASLIPWQADVCVLILFGMEEERLIAPETLPSDTESELSLRPKTLAEFIGQPKVKENLGIFLEAADAAASREHRPAPWPAGPRQDHARACHRQRDECRHRVTSGPALERVGIWRPSSPILAMEASFSSTDPPNEPEHRGSALSCDGGLCPSIS